LNDVLVESAGRLPIGKFGRALKDVSHWDLGTIVIAEAVKRAGVKGDEIEEVIMAHGLMTGWHVWPEGEINGAETCVL
jgi:acetyl-CoA C-acetyltransferase